MALRSYWAVLRVPLVPAHDTNTDAAIAAAMKRLTPPFVRALGFPQAHVFGASLLRSMRSVAVLATAARCSLNVLKHDAAGDVVGFQKPHHHRVSHP